MSFEERPLPSAHEAGPEIIELWPDVSGNTINGLSETAPGRPHPVFWRTDGSTSHESVMYYFFQRDKDVPAIAAARKRHDETAAIQIVEIAAESETWPAEDWARRIKAKALEIGADDVGICAFRVEWAFEDRPTPQGRWAIVMAFQHSYGNLEAAPGTASYIEIMKQYSWAGDSSKHLAN